MTRFVGGSVRPVPDPVFVILDKTPRVIQVRRRDSRRPAGVTLESRFPPVEKVQSWFCRVPDTTRSLQQRS
jgi:hypothetical protein